MVENEDDEMMKLPKWVELFLQRTFFSSCLVHEEVQKNEMNWYCITCDVAACRHCLSSDDSHESHTLLKIYRHVYRDVVTLAEMGVHIDCSNIQVDEGGACDLCRRRLNDPRLYRFCCLACKVESHMKKAIANNKVVRVDAELEVAADEEVGCTTQTRRKRTRKGVPHRSPLL
ncbi:PREDICTED: uncharacterized protein LOC109187415 [Ipomoea nil]|uniref:uncharacterized protein LOC109187415 n=1 Tax=Ipomoea nil TaxID=35883 RepID=UPI000900DE13|nr:PREDICTED: uncharacterized protein LOC109187415 [Ipomoea nil]